jgi:hypothetical protein
VVELESSLQTLAEWDTETSQNFAHHARRVYDLHYSSAQMQETLATLYESLISPSEWSGLQAG